MENNDKKNIPDWIQELSSDDARAIIDMVRMYQTGKRAMIKAIVTAIIGAVLTAVASGIIYFLKSAMIATVTLLILKR